MSRELPERRALPVIGSGFANHALGYTAEQMLAYAEEAVRLEREAAAQACEGRRGLAPPHTTVHDSACDDCAAAIRARKENQNV